MRTSSNTRSLLVFVILAGAVVFTLVAVGCFGGGDDAGDATATTSAGGASATTTVVESTTAVASMDPLSSFKSKDPFIPQAQLTTTTAPPTTATTIFVTTSQVVTTTQPFKLTVSAFPGGGYVAFTIGNDVKTDTFTSFQAGPALLISEDWGTIRILSVDDAVAGSEKATFVHNGVTEFKLGLGEKKQL